ncbi:hypothetical protein GJAV_G00052050 [Gymnothorax javanicus]|nr:hypothetical protein GJAV_G00052050 [Gymnothorax javanicus]
MLDFKMAAMLFSIHDEADDHKWKWHEDSKLTMQTTFSVAEQALQIAVTAYIEESCSPWNDRCTLTLSNFCSYLAVRMSGEDVNPAAVPAPVQDVQGDGRWMSQHLRFVQECKDAEPEVLFVGDSLVQLMPQFEVWRELFSPLHAISFGIGGDTTNNVLWRLQNGELQNIQPKVVVLWVGTNNHEHSAEQVAEGILAIVQHITSCLPRAKIVVLSLLPRGEKPNPLREKNAAVNGLLRSQLPRLNSTQFLDVSAGFVHSDGAIAASDMFDFLHLTPSGYRKVAKPLSDLLMQLLEETPEERRASLV